MIRGRARRRGVSDVVATILLLALTVTLFASIFAFVTAFPSPPSQNNNQFQATMIYTNNLKYVSAIHILHLAGPSVPGTALIYLKSATQPSSPEFLNPYTVASESPAAGTVTGFTTWNLGQVWNLTFTNSATYQPSASGNITIYIVSASQLLFSVILPGTPLSSPPTIVSTAISPANPWVGDPFTVYATVAGSYTSNSVYVNLAAVPGGPSTAQLMTQNSQGQWTYLVSAGASANGTYYGFVNASNGAGQQATGAVVITISNTGGTSGPPISVGVVAIPQPPTVYVGTNYFAAVITYSGSLSTAPLNVSFWVNQTSRGFTTHIPHFTTHLNGPVGLTISGPSTVTVYGTWPSSGAFSAWLLNSSVWINASATITGPGGGSASGTNSISSPNYVQGIVFTSTTTPSHSCTLATNCPYIRLSVWNNWTAALGGPGSLQFSGNVYANFSTGAQTHMGPYAISSNAVAAGASVLSLDALGGTTQWKPAQSGAFTITLVLTVVSGTTVVGYIFDKSTGTAT